MAGSTKAKHYHHGNLRNALLRVAAELVVSHGVEGFSLREAARRIGVTPTACYRHFSDKAALLAAVAIEGFAELAQRMESAFLPRPSPSRPHKIDVMEAKKRFYAVGNAYIRFAVENPAQFRVMFGPHGAGGSISVRGESKVSGKDSYQIFVEVLNGLVDSGAVSQNSRDQAELPAWAAIHGLAALLVDGLVSAAPEEALQSVIDNVIDHILKSMACT